MEIPSMSATEASKSLLGRSRRMDTWTTLAAYSIDPPELFAREDIHRVVYPEAKPNAFAHLITQELQILMSLGMVERVSEQRYGKDRAPAYYKRAASPGWGIVEAAIEAFNLWFPE